MSNTKHTPGPWRHCSANEGRCICGLVWSEASDSAVAEIHADHTLGLATIHDNRSSGDLAGRIPDDERVANMRLIAAAPEMLAMLELARTGVLMGIPGESERDRYDMSDFDESFEIIAKIDALIKKATNP